MTTKRRSRKEQGDALDLLHAEHRSVLALLETLRAGSARGRSASRKLASACHALLRHAQIEMELFYPLLRGKPGLDDLLDAALDIAKQLVFDLDAELRLTCDDRTVPPV